MEPRNIVRITLDVETFARRTGIGEGTELATIIHKFLISILNASKISDDESEYRTDFRPVQICTSTENNSVPSRRYHVSEDIAAAFYDLNRRLRDACNEYAEQKEALGKNLLVQMLKSDIIGEATNQK